MKDASKTLDPATLKIKLLPLEHYTNSMIAGLNSLMEGSSADILRNEAVTFSGESAWRVDHIFNYQGSQLLYGSTILVIKDGKLYEIGFDTKPLKVEEMRPIGEKIIQTFQFTNTNNTGTFQLLIIQTTTALTILSSWNLRIMVVQRIVLILMRPTLKFNLGIRMV